MLLKIEIITSFSHSGLNVLSASLRHSSARRNETWPKCRQCCFVSAAATLTSYSENMERGGKYGEGSRGNLKLWQSQKSGMDSFLYRVDENMTASTYSLNKIPERNLESMSSHSAHSIPLYLMPRPNSVAGESLPPSLSFSGSRNGGNSSSEEAERRMFTCA